MADLERNEFDDVELDEETSVGDEEIQSDDFDSIVLDDEESESKTTETEVESDQTETEDSAESSDDQSTEDYKAELDATAKQADQPFTLKHFDEVKEYSRDEVITLAQKGLDYDRIREERDSLKSEKARLAEHEAFLKDLAETAGTSIEDLIVDTKARLVKEDEHKKGYEITIEQARYRVQSEMKNLKKQAEAESAAAEPAKAPTPTPTQTPTVDVKALREANFKRFSEAYPNVKANEIPNEVWKEFGDGSKKDLTDIYARYENKQLKAQIAELEKNKQKPRSTGSRHSNGTPEVDHDFDGWGEY